MSQLDPPLQVTVRAAHVPAYADPITLQAGDPVVTGREDAEFPGWIWCRSAAGKEGWVHQSFLASGPDGAVAARDYAARELAVAGGECGELVEILSGWAFVRLMTGNQGWIPHGHLVPAAAAGD